MFQRTAENNRQEGDWLMPTHVEERNNTKQESQIPSTPLPLSVQSGTVPRHETSKTNSTEEVIIAPPSNQQVEEQSVHAIEMEPNPLNIEVRMQRGDMGIDGGNNVPIIQSSGNMMGEFTPSLNVQPESENNSDISRDSHVRTQEIDLREISSIPPMERLTSTRDRKIISENMSIG